MLTCAGESFGTTIIERRGRKEKRRKADFRKPLRTHNPATFMFSGRHIPAERLSGELFVGDSYINGRTATPVASGRKARGVRTRWVCFAYGLGRALPSVRSRSGVQQHADTFVTSEGEICLVVFIEVEGHDGLRGRADGKRCRPSEAEQGRRPS